MRIHKHREFTGAKVTRRRGRQPLIATPDAINWEKIRARATKFVEQWRGETSETAEAQSFWNDFFEIFGRTRRGLAFYEHQARHYVKDQGKLQSTVVGHVDMLWPGVLAVEHKSAGKSLNKAVEQLYSYINDLPDELKSAFGLVCDFSRFRLIDFNGEKIHNFNLSELPSRVELFGFFIEHEQKTFALELQANRDAAELMGNLYDTIKKHGHYQDIDRFLMRVLFCMFADDTGIWEKGLFLSYLENNSTSDNGMTGAVLAQVFDVLNTREQNRPRNLSPELAKFPYINGGLFSEKIGMASFDKEMRDVLLDACRFDWGKISPDIFGALFQSVRDAETRRAGGEHYTSEANILKVIRPLFLDSLERKIRRANGDKAKLKKLHDKIASMRFLDPACGCGNFLIVAYRELRRLEMEILLRLHPKKQALDIGALCKVNVNQFYGMEIDSFPANIAQTALWLVDHQMNLEVSRAFGNYFTRIPLTVSPNIHCVNALQMEWSDIVSPSEASYVFGNPPFVDRKNRQPAQQKDMEIVFNKFPGAGNLDYVAAWYVKATHYISGTGICCAFVSTDSITQSSQASILGGMLNFQKFNIYFAHRSFKWSNEGGQEAQVRVVIIGFSSQKSRTKIIYDYSDSQDEPQAISAGNINFYLNDSPDTLVKSRSKPLCDVPEMITGSNPIDKGWLLFSEEEKREFVKSAPRSAKFFRPAIGGEDYLKGVYRWCLWLEKENPSEFRKIAPIMEHVKQVKKFRMSSSRKETQKLAAFPHIFGEIRQPKSKYLVVPQTSSGARHYIPMGFETKRTIALIKCYLIPNANLYHFGVLSSSMHMAWTRAVCGRLGEGYSYTVKLVYNNFPWPENVTDAKRKKIMECAKRVFDIRKNYAGSSLGDMYSSMPRDLVEAHRALDNAVDRAYRQQAFTNENNRKEYLFTAYERLNAPIVPPPKKRRSQRKVKN